MQRTRFPSSVPLGKRHSRQTEEMQPLMVKGNNTKQQLGRDCCNSQPGRTSWVKGRSPAQCPALLAFCQSRGHRRAVFHLTFPTRWAQHSSFHAPWNATTPKPSLMNPLSLSHQSCHLLIPLCWAAGELLESSLLGLRCPQDTPKAWKRTFWSGEWNSKAFVCPVFGAVGGNQLSFPQDHLHYFHTWRSWIWTGTRDMPRSSSSN